MGYSDDLYHDFILQLGGKSLVRQLSMEDVQGIKFHYF